MIDTKELRRLALDGDLAAMQEIILRLEAAEKSDAESIAMYRKARDERDALRAKVEAMEQQRPFAWIVRGGYPVPLENLEWQLLCGAERPTLSWTNQEMRPLYALPGAQAQPAPSVPDGVAEALQRLIENGAVLGPASSEDALLVARYRQRLLACAPSVPTESIGKMLAQAMEVAVANGANSVSMPDELVEVAAWLSGVQPNPANGQTRAVRDVIAERRRQIEVEGWAPEHDDRHGAHELAEAAACYCLSSAGKPFDYFETMWPWERWWFKVSDPRRDLVKAGALVLAEIERLDRAAAPKQEGA